MGDDAGTSFATEPLQAKETGCWVYMSTRNNNFSNRSQKGKICVGTGDSNTGQIGVTGAGVTTDTGSVNAAPGVMKDTVSINIKTWTDNEESTKTVAVSKIVQVEPVELGQW